MLIVKRAWLFLNWCFGHHHRLYSESFPQASAVDISFSTLARKLSRNRLDWGRLTMTEHKCRVCGVSFWTLSNVDYCNRLNCYIKYHLYPNIYQKRTIKSPTKEDTINREQAHEAVSRAIRKR